MSAYFHLSVFFLLPLSNICIDNVYTANLGKINVSLEFFPSMDLIRSESTVGEISKKLFKTIASSLKFETCFFASIEILIIIALGLEQYKQCLKMRK